MKRTLFAVAASSLALSLSVAAPALADGANNSHGSQYGDHSGQYGSSKSQYGDHSGQYGSSKGQYGDGNGQYGDHSGQYGSSKGQYGSSKGQYGDGNGQYGDHSGQNNGDVSHATNDACAKPRYGKDGSTTRRNVWHKDCGGYQDRCGPSNKKPVISS